MENTPTHLPLGWHEDGTPIFNRGDFIRTGRPLPPTLSNDAIIYDELILPEHRHLRPEIKFNLILLKKSTNKFAQTVWLGKSSIDEKTGFTYPRIIQSLDSTGRILLQRTDSKGIVSDIVILVMNPLHLAIIPSNYETVLFNLSTQSPSRFFELNAREEIKNIDHLKSMNGPGYILKSNGDLEVNKNYSEIPIPRFQPGLENFKFLQKRPLYEMLTHYPKGFDIFDPPNHSFFLGSF